MTVFNLRTTSRTRNALLAACAAITLGTTAAQAAIVTTGSSGFWTAGQGPNDVGQNVCMISTSFADRGIGITVSNQDQRFHVVAFKPSWSIPNGARVSMKFQADTNPLWGGPEFTSPSTNGLVLAVAPEGAREFVHQITSGTTLHVYFSGNEQPWTASLSGTSGVWTQFMNCVQMVAPAVVASLSPPTQPFVPTGQTQPFAAAPPAPPSQPFNRI